MELQEEYIALDECCTHYQIEISFVNDLRDYGLLATADIDGQPAIATDQLMLLEKFIRLHYDLEVNMEGIDIIHSLIQRIDHLQQQVRELDNIVRVSHL